VGEPGGGSHEAAKQKGVAMNGPRLVVVVPAYNAARHLPGVIRRILAADLPGLHRVVVVDDGSTDATAAVARAFAGGNETPGTDRIEVIGRARNGGYGAAMKDGL